MKKLHHSLRFKVMLGLLAPLLIALTAFSWVQYNNQRRLLMENLRRSAANSGEIVEGGLQYAMLMHNFGDVQQIVDDIAAQPGVLDLLLLDKAGQVVLSAGPDRTGQSVSLSDATCQACHRTEAASRNESVIWTDPQGARVFRNVNAIENQVACQQCHASELNTTGVLITDFSMAEIDQQLAALSRNSFLWSVGSALVILFIVNFMMSQMVVTRLERFVRAIARVGEGDFGQRVAIGGSDEIADLADSFNRMAEGLQEKQRLELKLEERTSALSKAELALENLRRVVSAGPASTLQVAHELRSPAASMYQTLDVLLQGYAGGRLQDQVEMLSLVRDRARAMLAMVNDLLQLGAIRKAETDKRVGPVQLVDVLWQVVPEMRIKATLKGIDLQLDVPDRVPPIGGTEEQVRRLWANLIDNAIKYTDPGGTVRVQVRDDNGQVTGTVEDTGIGIAEQDMSRIFDEFYRAKNAKQAEPYGTGLGLSIVRRVVEIFGGSLDVQSELGEGTRFTFTFGTIEGASAPEAQTSEARSMGRAVPGTAV